MTPLFKQISLPSGVRNFSITDNIPNTSQTVLITFKSTFYHKDPVNSNSEQINRTVIDFAINQDGSSKLIPVLQGRSGVCGFNLNIPSPTGLSIVGYYFLWDNATNYPVYENFGIKALNVNNNDFTNQQNKNNVCLYWSDVDIWNIGDETSDSYRQMFFDKVGFKF
jgi:hypothetical protein